MHFDVDGRFILNLWLRPCSKTNNDVPRPTLTALGHVAAGNQDLYYARQQPHLLLEPWSRPIHGTNVAPHIYTELSEHLNSLNPILGVAEHRA